MFTAKQIGVIVFGNGIDEASAVAEARARGLRVLWSAVAAYLFEQGKA